MSRVFFFPTIGMEHVDSKQKIFEPNDLRGSLRWALVTSGVCGEQGQHLAICKGQGSHHSCWHSHGHRFTRIATDPTHQKKLMELFAALYRAGRLRWWQRVVTFPQVCHHVLLFYFICLLFRTLFPQQPGRCGSCTGAMSRSLEARNASGINFVLAAVWLQPTIAKLGKREVFTWQNGKYGHILTTN